MKGMENLLWHSKKPKFKQDCILIIASWRSWSKNPVWEYQLFEVVRTEGVNDKDEPAWYWAIISDDQEWGDIEDLKADYYSIIAPRKPLSVKQTKALDAKH